MAHLPPQFDGLRAEAEFHAHRQDRWRHDQRHDHGEPPEDPNRKPGVLKRLWRVLFP